MTSAATPAARERRRIRIPLLVGSAIAWVALVVWHASMSVQTIDGMNDGTTTHGTADGMTDGMTDGMIPGMPGPTYGSLVPASALMVAAMMLPLLVAPVQHLSASNFTGRRARAVATFLLGYLGIWVVVGVSMMKFADVAVAGGIAPVVIAVAALAAAVAWHCSPLKQRCLNHSHAHPSLPAFGLAAVFGSLRFGLTHGGWCLGVCWAPMLVAVVVPYGGSTPAMVAVMAAVTLWLFVDRLEPPARPSWSIRAPRTAGRCFMVKVRGAVRGRIVDTGVSLVPREAGR